jgi:hypothetical protein
MSAPWINQGPIGQGEIITAILQDCPDTALEMLHGWSYDDLLALEKAAFKLELLITKERTRRRR